MKIDEIIKALKEKRAGTFRTVRLSREILLKDGNKVFKKSNFQIQNLVEYSRRVNRQTQMPNWAEKIFISGVPFWRNKNSAQIYLPLNISGNKTKTFWYSGSKRISKKSILDQLPSKEKQKRASKKELEANGYAEFIVCSIDHITHII